MYTLNIDIREWLESHFEVKPAPFPLIRICCPFCLDKKFRMYVALENNSKGNKGWIYCHNLHCSDDFVELYCQQENIDYSEAARRLFSKNPDPPYSKATEVWKQWQFQEDYNPTIIQPNIVSPLPYYTPLWNRSQEEWQRLIPHYMLNRKITQEMCDKYFLGYCGLGSIWANRMIIPIYQNGRLVAYQGRAMYETKEKKYIFNTGSHVGDYLFNLDFVNSDWCILVEGVFDVWGVIRAGFDNVIASFGKHLTSTGIELLTKKFKRLYILWDQDASAEINKLAESLQDIMEIFVCRLEDKDPDEASSEDLNAVIKNAELYSKSYKYYALLQSIYKK